MRVGWRRADGRTAAIAVVAGIALVGCGDGTQDDDATTMLAPDFSATAVVDEEAGTITLPLDVYQLAPAESLVLSDAASLAMVECLGSMGVIEQWRPTIPEVGGTRIFGIWQEDLVAQFGYALPTSPEKEAAIADQTDQGGLTEAQIADYDACSAREDVPKFGGEDISPDFPYGEVTAGTWDAAEASPEAQQVFEDREMCLNEHGLQLDPDEPYTPIGATGEVSEANIRIALVDVGCKEEVDFVQRLADVHAGYQQPIVDEYHDALVQWRSEYDALLTEARAYLAEHRPEGA